MGIVGKHDQRTPVMPAPGRACDHCPPPGGHGSSQLKRPFVPAGQRPPVPQHAATSPYPPPHSRPTPGTDPPADAHHPGSRVRLGLRRARAPASSGQARPRGRLRDRRRLAIGTGTNWHAASQAAWLLSAAGLDVCAAQSADAAIDGPLLGESGALLAFTHTGAKRYTAQAAQRARARGAEVIQISAVGVAGADRVTVERERFSAYTASHLGALLRAAQLAWALGADLPGLGQIPRLSSAPTAASTTITSGPGRPRG